VNVSSSITPLKGERLTDTRPKLQWTDIDWKKVEEHVNRLQARITKAVKERKWHLVRRKKRPLSTPTMTVRTMQMLHGLRINLEGGSRLLRYQNATETNCCPMQKGL